VNQDSLTNAGWRLPTEAIWRPPTDVYETDECAIVTVEIAGLSEGDYQVTLTGRLLIISGERRDPAAKLAYQQMEIRYGRFRTQVLLPWALDLTKQSASYENGFLSVVLRKAQARRVPIRPAEETGQKAGEG